MHIRSPLLALALLAATPAAAEEEVAAPARPKAVPAAPRRPAPASASASPPAKPAAPAAPPSPPPPPPAPPPMFDVVDQENRLWRAMSDGDQAAVGALLADDLVLVGRNGVHGKAELLKMLSQCRIGGVEISEPRRRPLTADTTALAYRVRYRASCEGQATQGDHVETSVWMRQGPGWRLVLHTEIAAPAPP